MNRFCTGCGTPIEGARFCTGCGQIVEATPAVTVVQAAQTARPTQVVSVPPAVPPAPTGRPGATGGSSRRHLVLFMGVIVLVAVAGVTAGIGWGQRAEAPSGQGAVAQASAGEEPSVEEASPSASPLDGLSPDNVGCTGQYIVQLTSSIKPRDYRAEIERARSAQPDAKFLTLEDACHFSTQTSGIVTYLGPFDDAEEACQSRARAGFGDALIRRLQEEATHLVACGCFGDLTGMKLVAPDRDSLVQAMEEGDVESALAIRDVQRALLDDNDGAIEGTYVEALKDFQDDHDLTVDGKAGEKTWASMREEKSICPAS